MHSYTSDNVDVIGVVPDRIETHFNYRSGEAQALCPKIKEYKPIGDWLGHRCSRRRNRRDLLSPSFPALVYAALMNEVQARAST